MHFIDNSNPETATGIINTELSDFDQGKAPILVKTFILNRNEFFNYRLL